MRCSSTISAPSFRTASEVTCRSTPWERVGRHCKVETWNGTLNLSIVVLCFTAAGQPVDSKFTALFVVSSEHLAYAWAHWATPTENYSPSSWYSTNPARQSIIITRVTTGWYSIAWQGLDSELLDLGNIQVTSCGAEITTCKVVTLNTSPANTTNISCYNAAGQQTDSRFTVLWGS